MAINSASTKQVCFLLQNTICALFRLYDHLVVNPTCHKAKSRYPTIPHLFAFGSPAAINAYLKTTVGQSPLPESVLDVPHQVVLELVLVVVVAWKKNNKKKGGEVR